MQVVVTPSAVTYLLLQHLVVLVAVQGFEQVCRTVLEPHEQVAGRHSLL